MISGGTRILVLALSLLVAGPAGAGPVIEALRARQARIEAILARYPGEVPAAARDEVGRAIADLVHFGEMGRAAIGEEWDRRSEAERKDYVAAFEALVRANFVRRIDIYRSQSIEYQDETIDGETASAKILVRSKNATTEVVYALRRIDGVWRIVDYTIDGVSAVRNYKSQFARLLAKRGWSGLVERLRKRKSEIERGDAGDDKSEPAK